MPYVYKYIDPTDDLVKYVGIIRKDSNFPERFNQHCLDSWHKNGTWKIKYFHVDSVCDAEALEGHFISFYKSYEWFNKSKSDWGLLSFVPNIEWKPYKDPSEAVAVRDNAFYSEFSRINDEWTIRIIPKRLCDSMKACKNSKYYNQRLRVISGDNKEEVINALISFSANLNHLLDEIKLMQEETA